MATPDTLVVTVVAAEPVPAREDASGAAVALDDEASGVERCRICFEGPEDALPLVSLTCLCKGGLSQVHTPCAEAWFKRKGERTAPALWGPARAGGGPRTLSVVLEVVLLTRRPATQATARVSCATQLPTYCRLPWLLRSRSGRRCVTPREGGLA